MGVTVGVGLIVTLRLPDPGHPVEFCSVTFTVPICATELLLVHTTLTEGPDEVPLMVPNQEPETGLTDQVNEEPGDPAAV